MSTYTISHSQQYTDTITTKTHGDAMSSWATLVIYLSELGIRAKIDVDYDIRERSYKSRVIWNAATIGQGNDADGKTEGTS